MFYAFTLLVGMCIGASAIWYWLHAGVSMNDLKTRNNDKGYEIHHHKTMKVMAVYSKSVVYSNGARMITPEYLDADRAASDVAEWLKEGE